MDVKLARGGVKSAVLGAAFVAIMGLVAADPAEAALLFKLERLSDTEVRLTGSGSVGETAGPYLALRLAGVFATGSGAGTTSGTFQLGSLDNKNWLGLFNSLEFAAGSYSFEDTDLASGTSTLTRTSGTVEFAAIGATGIIVTAPLGAPGTIIPAGTWRMVAPVPIPAALPLFGAALVGVGVVARRKRNAGQA